jgi:hypothetical protein
MAELDGIKTLPQVVNEYLFLAKKPMDEYFRYQQMAINGFKEAKLFHLKGFMTVAKLTVSSIKTIDLPDDYMSFVAVGVPIQGQYWWLTEKDSLVFSQTGSTLDEDDGEGVDIKDAYYFDYQSSGGINREGYLQIDEANRRIILNKLQSSRTEVFLLYVSTGVNAGAVTYVPERAKNMIHAYMSYMDKLYTEQHPGLTAQAKDHYFGEVDKIKYLEAPSITAIKDALYEVTNQLPDR